MGKKNKTIDEIRLATSTIIVEENGIGGLRYISDSIGGGVVVWDTSIVDMTELIYCMHHYSQHINTKHQKKEEDKDDGG